MVSLAEIWKDIPGYEGAYRVSSSGRIWSSRYSRELKSYTDKDRAGRVRVSLKGKTFKVHTLVALAFLGPRPEGMEVCHNNGNPRDNRVENLRYDTHSENAKDIARHGRHHNANKTSCVNGHLFTTQNTVVYNGYRECRTCRTERNQSR